MSFENVASSVTAIVLEKVPAPATVKPLSNVEGFATFIAPETQRSSPIFRSELYVSITSYS